MESILILLSLGMVTLVLFRVFKYKFTKHNHENIGLSICGIIVSSEISHRPLSQFILLFILLLTFLIVIVIFKK
ncbi:hypothetical protein J31TS6_44910 [Brevibacillus reuszeri]|uniref:hypothetical protein n=1 Tax=Brevibacillus reuszeri TaxID=54915 RepID=UPI001B2AEB00|nr:hypothetical protein [Brevibacillus reuszeri]GIO08463.1 hypothetical protein J31TS6_44910 [Brevibacillus reuszeri]